MRSFGSWLFAAALLLWLSGCREQDLRRDPRYVKAIRYRAEGEYRLCEQFLLRHVEKYPLSRHGHRALADLYDESLDDAAASLYYFDRALALTGEDDPEYQQITAGRDRARRKLLAELSGAPPPLSEDEASAELQSLRQNNRSLREYILSQQRKIKSLEAQLSGTPAAPSAPSAPDAPSPSPDDNTVYTVQSGDTPGRIARRFYGSASEYHRILEANRLNERSILRIGQKLIIPKK